MKFRNSVNSFLFFILLTSSLSEARSQTLRIMPLGNSITAGNMCTNGSISDCVPLGGNNAVGYRLRLFNLLTDAGYDFDFVGSESYGDSRMSDPDCAGFGGIRDAGLADIMETGTTAHTGLVTSGPFMDTNPADIILLHIGTNDILAADTSGNDVGRILNAIDDYEASHATTVMVFLARIISMQGEPCNSNPRVKAYNRMMEELAASRQADGDQLILVDMECEAGIDYSNDLMDEVHPNQDGYDKMGEAWYRAIASWMEPPILTHILNMEPPDGSGSVSPSEGMHEYARGTELSLIANPAKGYEFSSWTGDLESTENPVLLIMTGDKRVKALFTKLRYTLTILNDGTQGAELSHEGASDVLHGDTTFIEVSKLPEGYEFDGWEIVSGIGVEIADSRALKTAVVLFSGDAVIRANFKRMIQVVKVSIPDVTHIIGDTVKADIHVLNDHGSIFQLVSGMIGDYPLENFLRSDSSLYVASFMVFEGGDNFQAKEDIPVSNLVITDGMTQSIPYSEFISQDHDLIDASAPRVLSLTVPSSVFGVGDTIEMDIIADGEYYVSCKGTIINGVSLESGRLEFSEIEGGEYRLNYIVSVEDNQVGPGEIEATVLLKETSGNLSSPYSKILGNALVINIITTIGPGSSEEVPGFFPNPATEYLVISLGDKNWCGSRIEIIDLSGRCKISLQISDGQEEVKVDISHLETGAYLVSLVNGMEIIWSDKLIKEY